MKLKDKRKLSHERLISCIDYCSETGSMKWKVKKSNVISIGDSVGQKVKGPSGKSYLRVVFDRHHYMAHQLAWFYVTGEFPTLTIDHSDGDGLNNKFSNLSHKSIQENAKNLKLNKRNKLGILGVYYIKKYKNFRAYIRHKGKGISLLTTNDFFEACCARKSAERRLGFHENHGSIRFL